jgi:hypothetical protein
MDEQERVSSDLAMFQTFPSRTATVNKNKGIDANQKMVKTL